MSTQTPRVAGEDGAGKVHRWNSTLRVDPSKPLRSKTRLVSSTPLERHAAIRRVGKRARKARAEWSVAVAEAVAERGTACEMRRSAQCAGVYSDGHHKLARGQGGKHTKENCLLVCRRCHDWLGAKGNREEAVTKGWIIERRRGVA